MKTLRIILLTLVSAGVGAGLAMHFIVPGGMVECAKFIASSIYCCQATQFEGWTYYREWSCVRGYLAKEPVQKIAFCGGFLNARPDDLDCTEITDSNEIKDFLMEIELASYRLSMREISFRRSMGIAPSLFIKIVTDKHKLIIPYFYDTYGTGEYSGVDWVADGSLNKLLGR